MRSQGRLSGARAAIGAETSATFTGVVSRRAQDDSGPMVERRDAASRAHWSLSRIAAIFSASQSHQGSGGTQRAAIR